MAEKKLRPSDKLNPKTIDPFANKSKVKSIFSAAYENGRIPCRLVHGSVKHKLAWSSPPESVQLDPILVLLAEGLKETAHPLAFIAREGFNELLNLPDISGDVQGLLPKIVPALRNALVLPNDDVFVTALQSLDHLSDVVGTALNPHLKILLVPLSKQFNGKVHKAKVQQVLQKLVCNGGQEAHLLVKAKIPTF